jgi:hypothetical protein
MSHKVTVKLSSNKSLVTGIKSDLHQKAMSRNQLNIRVSDELEQLIDKKRIELAATMKVIPTRSDVVRYALENYLGTSIAETDADRRKSSAGARSITKADK